MRMRLGMVLLLCAGIVSAQSPSTILGQLRVAGVTTNGGAGQHNRIVVTDAQGKIAQSLLPATATSVRPERFIYVDGRYTGVADGSQSHPYQTGAEAMLSPAATNGCVLVFSAGSYSAFTVSNITPVTICAVPSATIDSLTVKGATAEINLSGVVLVNGLIRSMNDSSTVITATDGTRVNGVVLGASTSYRAAVDARSSVSGGNQSLTYLDQASSIAFLWSSSVTGTVQAAISNVITTRAPLAYGTLGAVPVWTGTNWSALVTGTERYQLTISNGVPYWVAPVLTNAHVQGRIPFWSADANAFAFLETPATGSYSITFTNGLPTFSRVPLTYGGALGDLLYWDGTNWVVLAATTAGKFLGSGTTPGWSNLPVTVTAGTEVGQLLRWDGTKYVTVAAGATNAVLYGGSTPSFKPLPASARVPLLTAEDVGAMLVWDGVSWVGIEAGGAGDVLMGGAAPAFAPLPLEAGTALGQIAFWDGAKWTAVPAGTSEQVLYGGTVPQFQTPASGGVSTEERAQWNTNTLLVAAVTNSTLTVNGQPVGFTTNSALTLTSGFPTNVALDLITHTVTTGLVANALWNQYMYEDSTVQPSPAEWFTWTGDNVITITDYVGPEETQVAIPYVISNRLVTTIAPNAFAYAYYTLSDVYIPNSITNIGGNAFAGVHTAIKHISRNVIDLENLCFDEAGGAYGSYVFDRVVRVGYSAFELDAYITNLTFGASVQTIGPRAFASFGYHGNPVSLYWYGDCPAVEDNNIFLDVGPGVTNYVMNPLARGWGPTWHGVPVVKPLVDRDELLIKGEPVATSQQLVNVTSQLLTTFTNATGVTTAQVWRTGGAVSTNFFNSAAASTVCPTNWTRPTCWPVAAGYTVDTWLTPETNLIKILTVASPRESISFLRGPGGSFQVDWYGDGTHVSNYNNNSTALFSYPPSDYGRVIPIVAGYTNGWRVENVGGWSGYSPNATSTFTKVSQMLEFVGEPVAIGAGTMQSNVRRLKHIVIGTTTTLPSSWLAYSSVEKVVMMQNRKIPTSAFYDARTPQVVLAPAVTNIGIGAFQSCAILQSADFPLCETLANNAFIMCNSLRHLTPMPNLKSCGNDVFQNCDLVFSVITNFVGNLQATPAAPQFIDFQENPGTPEVKAWYFSGSVSNDLATLGWKLTL